jgi:HEAT repeat protein
MRLSRRAILGTWHTVAGAIFCGCLGAQPQPSLQDFFEQLATSTVSSSLPGSDEVYAITSRLEGDSPAQVEKAIPSIIKCLGHYDDHVKADAALALLAISRRPDGGSIIRPPASVIGYLLNLPEGRFQGMAVSIFVNLRPPPLREAVPEFVTYLRRADSGAKAQPAVAGVLVQYAPSEAGVLDAVTQFMLRPASSAVRIDTLNAVFRPDFRYDPIIRIVVAALDDPDSEVRSAAAQGLSRMGKYALGLGFLKIQKMADGSNEPASVKSVAEEALREYGAKQ